MGSRVLLADDSVTIQKVVGIIFANEDYELTVVGSGDAALQKAREIMPDVMLVDALMPGKNGYDVCREIRRDPRLSHISLLLMTGAFEVVDEEKNRQSGADDFITKPFESQALIDMTARLIALSRERASSVAAAPAAAALEVQPPPQPAPAALFVQAPPPPPAAAPAEDIWGEFDAGFAEESPAVQPLAAAPHSFAPSVQAPPASDDDLWGVFDMDALETQPVAPAPPVPPPAPAFTVPSAPADEDFFAFEEPAPAAAPAADEFTFGEVAFSEPAPEAAPVATGFEPFGEQEFSINDIAPLPAETVPTAPIPMEEDFSTISFDEPAQAPSAPSAMEIPSPVPPAAIMAPAPAQIAAQAPLDEEQLKMLLSRVSRDVIEKIVWEVVPDLAEAIIREEIRKIKEGMGR